MATNIRLSALKIPLPIFASGSVPAQSGNSDSIKARLVRQTEGMSKSVKSQASSSGKREVDVGDGETLAGTLKDSGRTTWMGSAMSERRAFQSFRLRHCGSARVWLPF
jgi:hypothetical protein